MMAKRDRKRQTKTDRNDKELPLPEEGREESLTPVDREKDGEHRYDRVDEAPLDYLIVDTDQDGDEIYTETAEATSELIVLGTESDLVMDEIDDHTMDDDIEDDFEERQRLNSGSDQLLERLRRHHSKNPDLAAGDIDAAWEDADVSGEESVGSTVVTPDQDIVDELGEAMGVTYDDDEPLNTADKLDARDRNRWELSPASMDDEDILDKEELGLIDALEDDLDADLDEDLDEDEEDELEEDLDDEFADEIENELNLDLDEEEDLEEDEDDDYGYDLDELDDEFEDEDDDYLDED